MKVKLILLKLENIRDYTNKENKSNKAKNYLLDIDEEIFTSLMGHKDYEIEIKIDTNLHELLTSNDRRDKYYILNYISLEEVERIIQSCGLHIDIDMNKYIYLIEDMG